MAPSQNPLSHVPTIKILAISHFIGTPMTPAQRAQIMLHEVHDTVNAYLAGKIDQRKHTRRGEKHSGEIPAGAGRFDGL